MKPLLIKVPVVLIVLLSFSCHDTRSQTTGGNIEAVVNSEKYFIKQE